MSDSLPRDVIPLTVARALGDAKAEVRKKAANEVGESIRLYLRDVQEGQPNVDAGLGSITWFLS